MLRIKQLRKLGFDVEDARIMVSFAQSPLGGEQQLVLAKYQGRYEAHVAANAQELTAVLEQIQAYPQPERYRLVDVKVLHRSRLEYHVIEAAEWVSLGI